MKTVVALAGVQKVPLPPEIDADVTQLLVDGHDDGPFLAGLRMIPRDRLRAIHRRAAEEGAGSGCEMAHALLAHLDDAETQEIALRAVMRAVERDALYAVVPPLGAAGSRGAAVLECAREALRHDRSARGAKVRNELRRGVFLAAAVERPRDVTALLPDEDGVYLSSFRDVWNGEQNTQEILARLGPDERTKVVGAWAELDWFGSLGAHSLFGTEYEELDVEAAPWPEIHRAFITTPLEKIGSRRIADAFSRDVPLAERTALAALLLERDDRDDHRDLFEEMLTCVREELGEGDLAPGGTWDRVARLASREEQPAPAPQGAEGEAEEEEEDDVARVRRLAAACAAPADLRIYALVRCDAPGPLPAARTASRPLGIEPPKTGRGKPMEHVVTLDFGAMPELRTQGSFGDDVAGVAVFITSRSDNEAYIAGSGLTAVVPLTAEEMAAGHDETGAAYEVHPIDVPRATFDEAVDAPEIVALRRAIRRLEGRALGSPWFLQGSDEEDDPAGFLVQFEESFVPGLNCGDGEMYVFADDAYWLC